MILSLVKRPKAIPIIPSYCRKYCSIHTSLHDIHPKNYPNQDCKVVDYPNDRSSQDIGKDGGKKWNTSIAFPFIEDWIWTSVKDVVSFELKASNNVYRKSSNKSWNQVTSSFHPFCNPFEIPVIYLFVVYNIYVSNQRTEEWIIAQVNPSDHKHVQHSVTHPDWHHFRFDDFIVKDPSKS